MPDTERIVVAFSDDWDEDLYKLVNLFDEAKWDLIMDVYTDPNNKKGLNEILREVMFT